MTTDSAHQRETAMTALPPEAVRIAVFAEVPVAGAVKTRLTARIGADAAVRLHLQLLRRTLETAVSAQTGLVSLWCTPSCDHPLLADCSRDFGVPLRTQRGADLGQRMLHALADLCRYGPALLVGCDWPALAPADLQGCAERLRGGSDAVFMPSEDGGYALLGLRRPEPFLFEGLSWGGSEVMDQTRARLREAGWRWHEGRTLWEADLPENFDRLLEESAGAQSLPTGGCPDLE